MQKLQENQLAGSTCASPLEGNQSKRVQVKPLNRQNENNIDRFCNTFALNNQVYYYILSGLVCFTNIFIFHARVILDAPTRKMTYFDLYFRDEFGKNYCVKI